MEKILLNDSYQINDSLSKSPKGIVELREDGVLLFKKENMIVENGRKFIKDAVAGRGVIDLTKIQFGNNTGNTITSPSDNALNNGIAEISLSSSQQTIIIENGEEINTPVVAITENREDEKPFIKYDVVLKTGNSDATLAALPGKENASESFLVSELGIYGKFSTLDRTLGLISEGEEKLFSRLVFDGVGLNKDRTYVLTYYLYF